LLRCGSAVLQLINLVTILKLKKRQHFTTAAQQHFFVIDFLEVSLYIEAPALKGGAVRQSSRP
jgi:hypothetical protein